MQQSSEYIMYVNAMQQRRRDSADMLDEKCFDQRRSVRLVLVAVRSYSRTTV